MCTGEKKHTKKQKEIEKEDYMAAIKVMASSRHLLLTLLLILCNDLFQLGNLLLLLVEGDASVCQHLVKVGNFFLLQRSNSG